MSENLYSAPQTPSVDLQAPEPGSVARGAWSALAIYLVGSVFLSMLLVTIEVLRVSEGNFTWERAGEMLSKIPDNSWIEMAGLVLERVVLVLSVITGTRIAARDNYKVGWIVGVVAATFTALEAWASDVPESLPFYAMLMVTALGAALLGAWLALRKTPPGASAASPA